MNGVTLLLVLGCGVIVSAAIPLARSQNINTNQNTNILEDNPTLDEETEKWNALKELDQPLGEPRLTEDDSTIASRAVAAGEAAKEILDKMAIECNEKATAAVAEAIVGILTNRGSRYNRRNYNYNTNTNILGGGRDYDRDERDYRDLRDSRDFIYEKDSEQEPFDDFYGVIKSKPSGLFDLGGGSSGGYLIGATHYGPILGRPTDYRQTVRPQLLNEVPQKIRHPDGEMWDEIIKRVTGTEKFDTKPNIVDDKAFWDQVSPGIDGSLQSKRESSDSVARNAALSRRRNQYPTAGEYEYPHLRPSSGHGNVNSNTNTNINSFRRNVNSNLNSNTNHFRRNINSNSNNNRIGQRPRRSK